MTEIDPRGAGTPGVPPGGARDRIIAARARLARELTALADDAATSAMERCPYRGRHDACFFGAGCRNRRYDDAGAARCAGGSLNPASAVRPDAGSGAALVADASSPEVASAEVSS